MAEVFENQFPIKCYFEQRTRAHALAGKMAAAAEDKQLGAEITGIARPTAKAPAGL